LARSSTNTITLICANNLTILANTLKGRRTNPVDQRKYYPNDLSMDRVPKLIDSYFDFGVPK
jgi:hypothetical protein